MKQLKIIYGESVVSTRIYVDDIPIGLVQDIKFHATADQHIPEIEITFPDLFPFEKTNETAIKSLSHYLELLKDVPNVKVYLQAINFDKEQI